MDCQSFVTEKDLAFVKVTQLFSIKLFYDIVQLVIYALK
jgi:hypothetical protein